MKKRENNARSHNNFFFDMAMQGKGEGIQISDLPFIGIVRNRLSYPLRITPTYYFKQ
jgi:hypothetical protein